MPRAIEEVAATDVVIVPSMQMHHDGDWTPGRYPRVLAWIRAMYAGGATVCSTCSGGLLTAETGLLDGHEATVHWISETSFRRRHPRVRLRPDRALVVADDGRLVSSGASTAWHDLALYLVARHVGPATAHALARFMPGLRPADGPRRRGDRRGPALDRRPRRRRQPGHSRCWSSPG
jgi:transcriptional regulator GlxA family with amidase domain